MLKKYFNYSNSNIQPSLSSFYNLCGMATLRLAQHTATPSHLPKGERGK